MIMAGGQMISPRGNVNIGRVTDLPGRSLFARSLLLYCASEKGAYPHGRIKSFYFGRNVNQRE